MGVKPEELVRKSESVFRDNYKGKEMDDEAYIDVMVQHPRLIQRPVVVKGGRAVIGRPPENVNQLF